MWLAKPLYEALPYYYIFVGAVALAGAVYVDHWYWPQICTGIGFAGIVGGLVVMLKRKGYRTSRSRVDFDDMR